MRTLSRAPDAVLRAFADDVGRVGPVCVRGGGTRWSLGGDLAAGTRQVQAPVGIVKFEPAEMTVRVRAGTTVAELHQALLAEGQRTSLPQRDGGTVGGALMAGESAVTRLGLGPVREALLQARYVCADGSLATAGAATVKNVSGFDLCRLLVGSLGTLGLIGEVLLRTRPIGEVERWFRVTGADPKEVHRRSWCAMSILHDGSTVWVLLGGYGVDVQADLDRLRELKCSTPVEVQGPPELPPHRWSCTPAQAASFGGRAPGRGGAAGGFVAEIGVGVVHASVPQEPLQVPAGVVALNRRFKERFDPTRRLNPGRDPLQRP